MRNHLMDYVFLFHPPKSGLEIQINKSITINDYVYNDLPIDYNGKEVRVGLGADGLVKLSVSAFFVMKLNVCCPTSHANKLSVGRFIGVPSPQKIGQSLKSLASMRSSKTCEIWLHPTTHRCVFLLNNWILASFYYSLFYQSRHCWWPFTWGMKAFSGHAKSPMCLQLTFLWWIQASILTNEKNAT